MAEKESECVQCAVCSSVHLLLFPRAVLQGIFHAIFDRLKGDDKSLLGGQQLRPTLHKTSEWWSIKIDHICIWRIFFKVLIHVTNAALSRFPHRLCHQFCVCLCVCVCVCVHSPCKSFVPVLFIEQIWASHRAFSRVIRSLKSSLIFASWVYNYPESHQIRPRWSISFKN